MIQHAYLVASGDLRLAANQNCWPAQQRMEEQLTGALARHGVRVTRAHPYDPTERHGFISSQRMGMNVFRDIPKDAPVIVAEAVWQYSYHVLAGLRDHRGPILTVGNWSGEWPGLVGLLNLNGSLTKMNVRYSSLWSEDFSDGYFTEKIQEWLQHGQVTHDTSHAQPLDAHRLPGDARALGETLAARLQHDKAILGVFDEGCMGMYNAIIDDELMNPTGMYKERLSQSGLVAEMRLVTDEEARTALDWLTSRGMTFRFGEDEATELTLRQTLEQLKMYIAAVRIAHRFGCDAIGIQYQQGLKDMAPASDLAEGLLNNPERPPVYHPDTGEELYAAQALPHFNEVDEGAGMDALVTNRIWQALGLEPSTTLHDLRWGEEYDGQFVWVFLISGAAPASHFKGGYAGASSERQPAMYFRLGGGTLKGVSKPGELVWSRVYVQGGQLCADLGLGRALDLPDEEVQRRWQATTPEWPIMNAVLDGVSRNQMMAKHQANHINVAYAPDRETARHALGVKAAMLGALGIHVNLCGDAREVTYAGHVNEAVQ
ncbi:helicase subunit of the DNA excision repair complex [Deinococcus peraridilitoris]|uniref:Helicase subunit of the DNA excision repair complex n=1 Tax=Deinococcus peraridilitoris (strain DSM 19664 / LMG 22246 / CIP 109416 / KR-200) TaxID=937777 RepID=L0A0C2_DEIPD|nr:helicase subunit of the DNA excision repair complex [Deinococcus peraridilitoris]AFZ66909.1 helicase subunit of the DNA excision repair complex [Deinococcus peraridilitoris DSM 19664]